MARHHGAFDWLGERSSGATALSLFSVTNNVSLITVNVSPGTFLAVIALLLCFLSLYRIISIIGTDTQCAALVLGCRCDHDWSSTAQAAPKGPACAAGTTTAAACPMTEATTSTRQSSVLPSTEPATDEDDEDRLPPASPSNLGADSEADSAAGGYSPPAWRRLDNGDRSSGFWRLPPDGVVTAAQRRLLLHPRGFSPVSDNNNDNNDDDNDNDNDDNDNDDSDTESISDISSILQRAIRTRLPAGSQNIRFAVRAEVQQRTEPIEAALLFVRTRYQAATSSWRVIFTNATIALLSALFIKFLLQPVASRPAGDLVKVAGVARSFEPLIYYSEHAVAQVHDLQATSVAVWDLGESVRTSDMRDAASIIHDLDALSDTMRTLSVEMTKFFARVDGDVDGILNVMDWARMHLDRLRAAPPASTLAAAYDNMHNLLSHVRVLEDDQGRPTSLGTIATSIFGLSNPQREQRLIQLLFTEFLTVLEESIGSELQHSVTLFALFEAVDRHFLNLARAVGREASAQEALRADALAGLWVRLLGAHASTLRKFGRNRELLRDIRDKTVRNKRVLVEHHGRLLTLQASLERLRGRLVSPLVRGANASTTLLSLEDQVTGIASVSEYLAGLRRHQKGKVMANLFSTQPGQRIPLVGAEQPPRVGGFDASGNTV
ncbi:hypothetical protein CCM_04610 [Cordyceps militaris CM01]|uniref:Uncharacterized protein n=1 Tax=Cordyceps militaris (strain CM01) TaxID=983644 RepID=G3JGA8_CORMM|nr:uncharacterized protein CCM_04610 [Cordyceps militaris CM01]EGX93238.1 hypothetical protein CCM_04610 [Cordyceps militaris CM01]